MATIKKTNGRKAGKVIHQYADTIMETAMTSSWGLTNNAKKEFIMSIWDDTSFAELDQDDDVELNHKCAFLMAMETWANGWYGDLDVEPQSVVNYFIAWGNE
jgi:hypothetical protein